MLTGQNLIAGKWISGAESFFSTPATEEPRSFSHATPKDVDDAATAAEAAFVSFSGLSREKRANFLESIADQIEARAAEITAIGTAETGLPAGRLDGERGRTTAQLRLFAAHLRKGDYLERKVDPALPDRLPLPRPQIRQAQRAIGPVAVFGASNFPLAFSTAGGDTASALAAGCPVVVRGHFAHPGTGEIIARAIDAAIQEHGIDPGVFSFIQGGGRAVGSALVQHPLIKAVGFTGSLAGGRALFDLCAQRAEPIPFFGELGSVNPMFLLPNAQAARGQSIGTAWAGSLTMGAGQFCTNPGIAVVIDGPSAQVFIDAAQHALAQTAPQTMLTDDIATAFRVGRDQMAASPGVQVALMQDTEGRRALPALLVVQGEDWLANPQLSHEVFGPLGLVIRLRDMAQMQDVAAALQGQLTCTLHVDPQDYPEAQLLLPTLERKAGRLLVNGFPTGVEVCDAQVHGGPYPASTNFGATSVGTLSIRRWLRPVAYQNFPAELLPLDC